VSLPATVGHGCTLPAASCSSNVFLPYKQLVQYARLLIAPFWLSQSAAVPEKEKFRQYIDDLQATQAGSYLRTLL
jgi:hypothetical protein